MLIVPMQMGMGRPKLTMPRCCSMVLGMLIFAISLWFLLISTSIIYNIQDDFVHGVHATTFGFIGNYTILGEIIDDDLWYVGYCLSTTLEYGNCDYRYYRSRQEEDAYYYTDLYCGNNGTAIPLNGYISTHLMECQLDDFNPNDDRLIYYKKILIISSVGIAITMLGLVVMFIFDIVNTTSYRRATDREITTQQCQLQSPLSK